MVLVKVGAQKVVRPQASRRIHNQLGGDDFRGVRYLRSKRSMSFHATNSETFSGYTFCDVSQS